MSGYIKFNKARAEVFIRAAALVKKKVEAIESLGNILYAKLHKADPNIKQ